jgi:hypothetical protein
MIDLLATRPHTDVQTRACARLLTAVIADSIRSIGTKPSAMEQRLYESMGDAHLSLNFLFNPTSPFEAYCRLIGLDADLIRRAISGNSEHGPTSIKTWSESEQRHAQARIRWFLAKPMGPMVPKRDEPAEAGPSLSTKSASRSASVKDSPFTCWVSTDESGNPLDGHQVDRPPLPTPFDVLLRMPDKSVVRDKV